MSCRVALLKMHREGIITLPPTQRPFNRASKHTQRSLFTQPKVPIEKKAGDFKLCCEIATGGVVKLWNEFIDRYHYLGYTSLAGAQIRYFVKEHDEILALLRELQFTKIPFIMSPNFTKRGHDHEDINCNSERSYPASDRIGRSIG